MAYRERDNPIPAKIPNRRSSFSGKAILAPCPNLNLNLNLLATADNEQDYHSD